MRVIPCKVHEAFRVGNVKFTVLKISGERVRFRVEAPNAVGVYREEVIHDLNDAARRALAPDASDAPASDQATSGSAVGIVERAKIPMAITTPVSSIVIPSTSVADGQRR